MSTDMLEDIHDGSQSHPGTNKRETRYRIRDSIKQSQAEWKGALLSTRNMGKVLHKVFNAVVNDISHALPILGESVSKVPYLIPEPRKFIEVTWLSEDINKPWLKATLKEIKNLINNQTFLVQYPENSEPMTPCMDVYEEKN